MAVDAHDALNEWQVSEQSRVQRSADQFRERREGMDRPLQMRDLSPDERKGAWDLLNEKSQNIRPLLEAKNAAAVRTGKSPKPEVTKVLSSPALKPRNVSLGQMASALVDRTERAASGPERLEGESLAGTGFYFGHRRALAEVDPPDIHTLALASSRLSPLTSPKSEKKTAASLSTAHSQQGTVRFTPEVVKGLGGNVPEEHIGRVVPFSQLHPKVVSLLRKGRHRDLAYQNSQGVDWDSMRSVGLDSNVERAHGVLQGDPVATPDIYKNPKQTGYAESISQATPGAVEEEYLFRASHLGKTIRGEIPRGQMAIDTGLMHSNAGMLSNNAPIAADTWTRRAASGHPLEVSGPVSDTFISAKGDVGKGDTRVTPVGIEHAAHQAAVEEAAKRLQKKHGTEFTIPSRLIQETGGWGQPRREAGWDPDYNKVVRDQQAEVKQPRNVNSRQLRLF